MHTVAKKLVLVLSMLAVITAQLFNAAFAMQMSQSGSAPESVMAHAAHDVAHVPKQRSTDTRLNTIHLSHLTQHTLSASVGADVGSGCCDQSSQSMSHCDDSVESRHHCDNHADCAQSSCAQSHCVSSVGCGLSHYILDIEPSLTVSFSVSHLLLPQNSLSLYRPPIFR